MCCMILLTAFMFSFSLCSEVSAETSNLTVYAGEIWSLDYHGEVRWIESTDNSIVTADYSKNRVTVSFKALRPGDATVTVHRKYLSDPVSYNIHVMDNSGLFSTMYVGLDKSSKKYVWEISNESNINFKNVKFTVKYPGKKSKKNQLVQGIEAGGTAIAISHFATNSHAADAQFVVSELEREVYFQEGSKLSNQVSVEVKRKKVKYVGTDFEFYINNSSNVRPDVTVYAYIYDTKSGKVLKTLECTYYHEAQGMKRVPRTIRINGIYGKRLQVYCWCSSMVNN